MKKPPLFVLVVTTQNIPENPNDAEKIIEKAIELGVRFFDNARGYHKGRSEEYYGNT
ncbi:MAG: aldo/keto reductase [Cyclobacteriaceae bacterium]|nr:aldo/keto reductase [Cyclobacteriaceae bacterium]